jgi:hypothetical protein
VSVSKFLEISAVDREDLVVTARQNHGWIEIRIHSGVKVPVPLILKETETLLLVIVPEKREPMTEAELRAKLHRNAVAARYGIE